MKVDLKNKSVLFIGPVFYDYHSLIKRKIELLGATVSFFAEKQDGLLFGILNNLNPSLINIYQKYYYWNLLKKIKDQKFTHFLLIRGYKIPDSFLIQLKENNPGIKFILYEWDSERNNPYFHILKHFDEAYTFDHKDYKDGAVHGNLKFLQLFYTEDIGCLKHLKADLKYDYFCFSSFTLKRYHDMISFTDFCKTNNFKLKSFCFIPYSTYFRLKFLQGIALDKNLLSFKTMPRVDYIKFLHQSEVVVDLSHATQTGLSMRVIETYGAGKKIITTNQFIIDNPIYSPDWVQIVDSNFSKKPKFDPSNASNSREDLDIDSWINRLFN